MSVIELKDRPTIRPTVSPAKSTAADDLFDTDRLQSQLKTRSVRGGAATVAAQAAKFVLRLGSTAILARLLVPTDFGLIAMVTAVTGYVALFKDGGLSLATIQRADVNHDQVSTLFWINVGLSSVLAVVAACLAPFIAWFYAEPRLTSITLVVAGTFVFSGFSVQHQALLRRQMRFGSLAVIEVASQTTGIVAAVVSARMGAGYWALVILFAATAAANAVLIWIYVPWRPGWPRRRTGVRPMLAYGGNFTGASALNYMARNADNMLIGWWCGAGALGLYSRAYQLLLAPLQQIDGPIRSVAVAALSRLQDKPESYRSYFRRGLFLVSTIQAPLTLFVCVAATEIVQTLLGDAWLGAVPILYALTPALIVSSTAPATTWVFPSTGRADRQLRMALVCVPITLTGFLSGLSFGPVGVALAFSVTICLMRPFQIWYCFRTSPLAVADFVEPFWKPFAASAVAATITWLTAPFLDGVEVAVLLLLAKGAVFAIAYSATVILLSPELPDLLRRTLAPRAFRPRPDTLDAN